MTPSPPPKLNVRSRLARSAACRRQPKAQRHRQRPVAADDEEFRQTPCANADGSIVKLGDVARVEKAAETQAFISRYNGRPATGLGRIKLAPAPTPWPPLGPSRPR